MSKNSEVINLGEISVKNNKSSNFELDVLSIANKLKDINKK